MRNSFRRDGRHYTIERRRRERARRRRRLFGFHRANETHIDLENTGSIHIWAVAVCTDKATHWSKASLAAAGLALVVLQLAVLTIVQTEAAYPGCSAHTECRFGEVCSIWHGTAATASYPCLNASTAPIQSQARSTRPSASKFSVLASASRRGATTFSHGTASTTPSSS